ESQNSKTQLNGVLILLLTAIIWGASFVSQSVGAETVEPFTFMAIRTLMGATVLVPFILLRDRISAKKMTEAQLEERKKTDKKTIVYGAIIGVFLAIATNLQQYAFNYSTAGKIAFITAMYMFFVPIFGLFIKKRIPLLTWICIAMGFVGLFCLCFKGGDSFAINKGDLLTLICALFFTCQILLIERFSPSCDGIKLSCAEFYTAGLISLVLMLIFDKPQWQGIKQAGGALLYSGIMSCGVAYTLQVVGQKYCEATIASLLMCMESVFAALSAAILINERLAGREILGCAIMFTAIIISQLTGLKKPDKS
ncbi:MAG: DMT family transporter, partial [Spirochaetaceae bacterium]|nr:DMT family transporter [Spirochaetaceae bacterium]